MYFSNPLYDRLRFLAQIFLPACGTLYFALAGIWDLPAADEIVGTVVAVDTFLGVCLGISTSSYNKSDDRYDGEIHVLGNTGENERGYSVHLPADPKKIEGSEELRIKVKHPEGSQP